MAVSDEQLQLWSQPTSSPDFEEARKLLEEAINSAMGSQVKFEVYVQGSYANGTNLANVSDVDIIIELAFPSMTDIPQSTEQARQEWTTTRDRVASALQKSFPKSRITVGPNAIRIETVAQNISGDAVVAMRFVKNISTAENVVPAGTQGMAFFRGDKRNWVINYPKLHLGNTSRKETATGNRYKRTVRIFKNIRNQCRPPAGMKYSSYLVESLIFNVPNELFVDSLRQTVVKCVQLLSITPVRDLRCPNLITKLCGEGTDQFTEAEIKSIISDLGRYLQN